jgi:NADH-quinone oxidoreductase subunit M
MIEFFTSHLLSITCLAPFIACITLLMVPPERKTAARVIALSAGIITLVTSITLCLQYDGSRGGFQFQERYPWLPFTSIDAHLGADGISIAMILLTAIIITTGVFASWTLENRSKEFLTLLLFLVTGVFGVFCSLDLFFLFLFYEIAVLPMYLLIGVWGTGKKEYSAMKLTLYLMLGSALILTGILAVYHFDPRHSFNLVQLSEGGSQIAANLQRLLFLCFYLGFGVLAGIWPFHTWSPDGHASAPTAVSMLHAGVLMKLGAYGIIRTCIGMFPHAAPDMMIFVCVIAAINIVYGAFSAMGQKDLKYVIAYSSVSHMGVVMLGIGGLTAIGMNGAVMQMFSHGIMTGLFFALVGLVYEKTHTRDITAMGGLATIMPGIAIAFIVGGFASFGLPATSGFIAEFLVFFGTFASHPVVTSIAAAGIVITAVYVLRVVQKVFFGPRNDKYSDIGDAKGPEWVALTALAAILIVVGLYPKPLIDLISFGLKNLGVGF